jgi:predicted RNA-binding protein
MCQSTVYLLDEGKKERVMEDVVSLKEEDGRIVVIGLLGEQKEVPNARIVGVRMEPMEVYLQKSII